MLALLTRPAACASALVAFDFSIHALMLNRLVEEIYATPHWSDPAVTVTVAIFPLLEMRSSGMLLRVTG